MRTRDRNYITFTTKIGSFFFPKDGGLSLSKMKLIRDSVLGRFTTSNALFTSQDCYDYVAEELEIKAPFSLVLSN